MILSVDKIVFQISFNFQIALSSVDGDPQRSSQIDLFIRKSVDKIVFQMFSFNFHASLRWWREILNSPSSNRLGLPGEH